MEPTKPASARGLGASVEYAPWRPGERVRAAGYGVVLRSLTPQDIDEPFVAQLREPQVVGNLALGHVRGRLDRAAVVRWLAQFDNRQRFFLGIWPAGAAHKIGFCQARVDDFGVALISLAITEPSLWRRGAAAAATYLLRFTLFDLIKVHKLAAAVYSNNAPVIAGLEEYGWIREGLFREAEPATDGSRRDVVLFGMLKAEHLAGKPVKPFVLA